MLAIETIAATPLGVLMPSVWYKPVMPGLPDILLMRRHPELMRDPESPCLTDHFKPVYVETAADRTFVETCLAQPMHTRNGVAYMSDGIGKTNLRRSELPHSQIHRFINYAPPSDGWPHLVVTMSATVTMSDRRLSRGRYLFDAHATDEEVAANYRGLVAIAAHFGMPMVDIFAHHAPS